MKLAALDVRAFIADRLLARNEASRVLFERQADALADACDELSQRFLRGGRLLAFGHGAMATDAQHVAVEFVHPVIVGKRALPAIDLSSTFERSLPDLLTEADVVMGFSAPEGDGIVARALEFARSRGAQIFALPAVRALPNVDARHFAIDPPSPDPFVSQELIEILYHTLWETVHVFLEHRGSGQGDLGSTEFLYPFLAAGPSDRSSTIREVAESIRAKAAEDERLRVETARDQSPQIADAIAAVQDRLDSGATLHIFGNGGSATDATDWAIDCCSAPPPARTVKALSLSMDPAIVTAIANDVGVETIFLRQLIAYARPGDVAVAISTSGGSANVIAALEEARKRGLLTVALLGYDGGEIVRRGLADVPIVVRCDYIPRIQEVQASIYHVMTEVWRQWIS